jgi:competence protein ComEA
MNTNVSPDPIVRPLLAPIRRIAAIVALCALVATVTATWLHSAPAAAGPAKTQPAPKLAAKDGDDDAAPKTKAPKTAKKSKGKQALAGKLNLNTATADQLQLLPGVGAEKAERVVTWRQKNGGFKRVADLRKVKGFGYKTLKKLEKYLDVSGANSLAAK